MTKPSTFLPLGDCNHLPGHIYGNGKLLHAVRNFTCNLCLQLCPCIEKPDDVFNSLLLRRGMPQQITRQMKAEVVQQVKSNRDLNSPWKYRP